MRTMDVLEAKMTLSALLIAVEAGEESSSRAGRPVARLVAVEGTHDRVLGADDGRIWIADDFDSFVPEGFES